MTWVLLERNWFRGKEIVNSSCWCGERKYLASEPPSHSVFPKVKTLGKEQIKSKVRRKVIIKVKSRNQYKFKTGNL